MIQNKTMIQQYIIDKCKSRATIKNDSEPKRHNSVGCGRMGAMA